MANRIAAQEVTPPKYNGADMQYYMGRLVGESVKIAEEEFVPAGELSPEVIVRCTIDTLGRAAEWRFLDNTLEGNDFRDLPPATPRTRELLMQAAARLGGWAPAVEQGQPIVYRTTMRLRIPVEKIAAKQEGDPLLFLGMDPKKSFHPWASNRIRFGSDEFAKKADDGVAHVRFYIEPDGRITIGEVVKAPTEKLGKEVARIIRSSKGKWTPRKVRGVPQRTAYDYRINCYYE